MRGDDISARRVEHALGRFTPTCVGTTPSTRPRTCPTPGSPPRAWGRLADPNRRRFTPTCVGTTFEGGARALVFTVHPHVRGDDDENQKEALHLSGSPPRAWGRRCRSDALVVAVRFTPTCVGTTRGDGRAHLAASVHPHVRGDDFVIIIVLVILHGSPPRAWGRHRRPRNVVRPFRFTPTCVGTTTATCRSSPALGGSPPRAWGRPGIARAAGRRPPVHPHVRGDDVSRTASGRA